MHIVIEPVYIWERNKVTCEYTGGFRVGQKLFAIDRVSQSWHSESVNHIENVFCSVACHLIAALLKRKSIFYALVMTHSRHDARQRMVAKLYQKKVVKTKGDPLNTVY